MYSDTFYSVLFHFVFKSNKEPIKMGNIWKQKFQNRRCANRNNMHMKRDP